MKLPAGSFFLIVGLLLTGCSTDGMGPEKWAGPEEFEPFSFEFTEFGGFAGYHNVLHITASDSVTYTGANYHIRTVLETGDKLQIFNILANNGFFRLDTSYYPDKRVADDIIYTLQYNSATYSHRVGASGYCSSSHTDCTWPADLHAIIDAIRPVITDLKEQPTSGCATVYAQFMLEEWPFGQIFNLADSLSRTVEIHDSLYHYIRAGRGQDIPIKYYEDGWIYRLNTSFHYGTPHDDPEADTTLSIHDRAQPIYWNVQPPLSEIADTGIVLAGSEYLWLKNVLKTGHYPWYFMDDALASGALVYQLSLDNGIDCQLR